MKLSFPNARANLWENLTTISGLDPGGNFYAWYDMYTDEFCKQLTSLECTSDEDYSVILTRMNEFSHVGEFLCDEKTQLAELAAFGLILFERIIQAIADKDSHEAVFDMHEGLAECLAYVMEGAGIRSRARAAGLLGGRTRAGKYEPLKIWALEKASVMRGDDKGIARRLLAELPSHLALVSDDPERLIYDALRARKKLN